MRLYAGTSGFSYDEWAGSFYPEKLPAKQRLAYYATRLTTVEINNTFYRTPKESIVDGWRTQVTGDFRFVLKASQRLTHQKRLQSCGEDLAFALSVYRAMQERLGPILFQLPPSFRRDLARLAAFLEHVPSDIRAAFEFRSDTWFGEDTYALLRAKNAALVVSDVDEAPEPPLVPTADWGYFRLRRVSYAPEALRSWLERARAQPWNEAYVFFKHEDAGTGPRLAGEFLELARQPA
jgi:uncharacterized protein YecE (DUF72 family)